MNIYRSLHKEAKKGDAKANYQLALMCFEEETKYSEEEFLRFFKVALANKHPQAVTFLYQHPHLLNSLKTFLIENFLENNNQADEEEDIAFFRVYVALSLSECSDREMIEPSLDKLSKLAKKGHVKSQLFLSKLYENGKVVHKSISRAKDFLQLAAEHSAGAAQKLLHTLAKNKPSAQAFHLAEFLTRKGYSPALFYLAYHRRTPFYFEKIDLEKNYQSENPYKSRGLLTSKQEFELAWLIYEYYQEKADKGDPRALVLIGNFYRYGKLIFQSYSLARKYFQMAADQDYPQGLREIGCCYFRGTGGSKSEKLALQFLEKSALLNELESIWLLALHAEKSGALTESFAYFKKAADLGDAAANYVLGRKYEYGQGVRKSSKKAFEYYLKAAEQNLKSDSHQISVQHKLAECFYEGKGILQSIDSARKYFQYAAKHFKSWRSTWNGGVCFLVGEGIDNPYHKAEDYFALSIQRMEEERESSQDALEKSQTFDKEQSGFYTKWIEYRRTGDWHPMKILIKSPPLLEGSCQEALYRAKYRAISGDSDGSFDMGLFYLRHQKDYPYVSPETYFVEAAFQAHSKAMFYLWDYDFNSLDKLKYLEWSGNFGETKAIVELAKSSLPTNPSKANELLKTAARLRDSDAMIQLAELEPETNLYWYTEAAKSGHPKAYLGLGALAFRNGDKQKAIRYFDLFMKGSYQVDAIEWICDLIAPTMSELAAEYRRIFLKN